MALTPVKLAQTATGWTDSNNATGASTDVATAFCTRDRLVFTQSPSLVLGSFQLDCLGVAAINSLFIRVAAKSAASNPILSVYLSRDGVQRGSVKTIPLDATLQERTLGGDLWGTVLTDADCRNLQVVCFVDALDGGTHSISYVSARADIPTGDAIPTAFSFTGQSGVAFLTLVTSNAITVGGTDIASCISIVNGEWEKNANGVWSSADGSVSSGETVKVRHTSPNAAGALTETVLTIGSVIGTFGSTTTTADTVPDTINFPSGILLIDLLLNTYASSGQTQITGINAPSPISISGGHYSINGAAYTNVAGTINNLDLLEIRCLSSSSFNTSTSCTVTVGGVSRILELYSILKYGAFTPYTFTPQTGVAPTTLIISNSITFAGWEAQFDITVSGGEFDINGLGFRTTALRATNGQTMRLRHTSGAVSTSVTTTVTATGVAGSLSQGIVYSTTFTTASAGADITPVAFSFASLTNVENTQPFIASAGAITGINVSTPVAASGSGLVSIAGGAYVASGFITSGQTLSVKLTSSAQPGYTTTTTVTVGTVSADFSVKTDYVINADF